MTLSRPLRLRPGVILAILLVVAWLVPPTVARDATIYELPIGLIGMVTAVALGAAIVLWWLLFSRAPWVERVGAVILMIVAVLATRLVADESIRGAGQEMLLFILPIPVLSVALVAWAAATHRLPNTARRAWMVVAIALACVPFAIVRTGGVGGGGFDVHWRWTPTAEERLLAQAKDEPMAVAPPPGPAEVAAPAPVPPPAKPVEEKPADTRSAKPPQSNDPEGPAAEAASRSAIGERHKIEWPGFRGPNRDSVIAGLRINTDWAASPPAEIWRKPLGPGWSSFAVDGDLIYTQEQRGEEEMVSCYRLSTGLPVWRHRDAVRFYESNGGAGPRGTPTLAGGRVYALGATGIINALDARTGAKIWSRSATTDTGKEVPYWGIASSPLVIDDLVILGVAGQLIAYDAATGNQRWIGQSGGAGYSSPHLATIDGVPQVLLIRGARIISVSPADGTLLWEYVAGAPAASIVQPAFTPEGDVLIAPADAVGGNGIWRVTAKRASGKWTVEERWQSRGLKPNFSDYVVHEGHAYGFDGTIMSAIDLATGERKWKGGRYGNGQLLLLAEQDVLLVTTEEGEIALVSATPDKFTEIARIPALNAKTWNHPVIVRDILLVRNGEEMAAFRLPLVASPTEMR
jgi:outer membrane protein assembly factor BamB